jgi:lysophospholipase L1-like esterase
MSHSPSLRYLALGDSYTIGESVDVSECFPVQTTALLNAHGLDCAAPVIIAKTGWTCSELADGIAARHPGGPFDLVSLLIGVNDQYRGYPLEAYGKDCDGLMRKALAFVGGNAGRVFILSIPDWGVTPFAEGRDRYRIAKDIDAFNAVNRALASSHGFNYLDITPLTRNAVTDGTLVATDGLHPSARAYRQWAALLASWMADSMAKT